MDVAGEKFSLSLIISATVLGCMWYEAFLSILDMSDSAK